MQTRAGKKGESQRMPEQYGVSESCCKGSVPDEHKLQVGIPHSCNNVSFRSRDFQRSKASRRQYAG